MSLQRWRVAGPLSSLVPGATVTWNLCTAGQTEGKGTLPGVAEVGGRAVSQDRASEVETCLEVLRMSVGPTYIPPILQDLP